jgi:hypothetical protein
MKYKVAQLNLNDETDLERYRQIMNEPGNVVEDTAGDFTKGGEYIVKVRYAECREPQYVIRSEVHDVEIVSLDTQAGRERYEHIYNCCRIEKEVQTFNKKTNTFIVALHYYKTKPTINMKYYEEVNKCLIK